LTLVDGGSRERGVGSPVGVFWVRGGGFSKIAFSL